MKGTEINARYMSQQASTTSLMMRKNLRCVTITSVFHDCLL